MQCDKTYQARINIYYCVLEKKHDGPHQDDNGEWQQPGKLTQFEMDDLEEIQNSFAKIKKNKVKH